MIRNVHDIRCVGNRVLLFLSGTVVHGFGRGSKELNCPTANIDPVVVATLNNTEMLQELLGQNGTGIFFGFAQLIRRRGPSPVVTSHNSVDPVTVNGTESSHEVEEDGDGQVFPMSASFGYNPCYNNSEKSLEVHLIHSRTIPDFYGSRLKVVLIGKLRDEAKFDSLAALKDQIELDKKETIQRIQCSLEPDQREHIMDKLVNLVPSNADFVQVIRSRI